MSVGLEDWLKERPRWLQTAATIRLSKSSLDEADLAALTDLCLKEATGIDSVDFKSIPPGSLVASFPSQFVKIAAIKNPRGINALRPTRPLEFATNDGELTIVYGFNGAGKSSYSRLLKHICGSRFSGELYPNAFESVPSEQAAEIVLLHGSQSYVVEWTKAGGPVDQLCQVHIFDTDCADSYLKGSVESAFEPTEIRFIAELIEDCTSVDQRLADQAAAYPERLPALPLDLRGGALSDWLKSLSGDTTDFAISEACSWSEQEAAELRELDESLALADPVASAAAKRRKETLAAALLRKVESLQTSWSLDIADSLAIARGELQECERVASEAANSVFSNSPLAGVSEPTWRALWEAARAYSETIAYPGQLFPVLDKAVCVLCQQPLLAEGSERMKSFDSFVRGALAGAVTDARRKLEILAAGVVDLPLAKSLESEFEAVDLSIDSDALYERLRARHDATISHQRGASLPLLDLSDIVQLISERLGRFGEEATSLEQSSDAIGRAAKVGRRLVLNEKLWLSQQVQVVRDEVLRKRALADLEKARQLAGTHALTRKKNDLSAELLASAHEARFLAELAQLGGERLPIKILPTRGNRSAAPGFQVSLNGAQNARMAPNHVLSEGERRIVALSAFLADVTGGPTNVPFVFDDPISSLDQRFEESTAKRLILEAKNRQVIVFTHRLSMLALLEDLCDEEGVSVSVVALRGAPEGTGSPGQTSMREKRPDKALNKLKDERLPQARKAIESGDHETGEVLVQAICSDFRVLIERLIETTLLNGVVQRFQKNLTTKDRLQGLARIRVEDCALLESMMTKYSYQEHSQPMETPVPLPRLDDLAVDLKAVAEWVGEFSARKIPASVVAH